MDNKELAKLEFQRRAMVLNEANAQLVFQRQRSLGRRDGDAPDRRRRLDEECGYPEFLMLRDYVGMHDREGIATRVNSLYPDECWAVDPNIKENERKADTPFEAGWKNLLANESTNPLHYLHRVDILSGIGHFGILLLGTDDGATDLAEPLPGIDEMGRPTPRKRDLNLLYLRAFGERSVRIATYQTDYSNPRFSHPLYYEISFADMHYSGIEDASGTTSLTTIIRRVHWSRIIHIADNRLESEVFGIPRLRTVFDKLMDVHKILGSSAEMLYKGGFPGVSIELDPRVLEAMPIEIDEASVDAEMYKYMNGLQRYLLLIGLNAKPLSSQVADPTPHLMCQLNSIAMTIGCPVRIFAGSEQGQLASGQDSKAWNRRIKRRHERYLTPLVLRPFIDRLLAIGALPPTKKAGYSIFWPDINMPDEDQRSQVADRRAAAMMKYVSSGATKMMQPSDFYRFIWGLNVEEIAEVMTNLTKPPEVDFPPIVPPGTAADSGVAGHPPSDPPAGGKG